MSPAESPVVHFFPLADQVERDLDPAVLKKATTALVSRLALRPVSQGAWAVKVHLGARGRPAAVSPEWVQAGSAQLGGAVEICDTLSITSEGLHTPEELHKTALAKGYAAGFKVADDPALGEAVPVQGQLVHPSGRPGRPAHLAAGLASAQGVLVMNAVDTHPHLGFQGAMAQLALGCSDRQAKLDLHRDIRPKVDTPLCAGCGSCLAVCIFDAIDLKSGRAMIDHTRCTGCGECMTVCHLAGIAAENPASLETYQVQLAETATALWQGTEWQRGGRLGFVNYLVHLDRRHNRSAPRAGGRAFHLGVLASRDPVALDRATWDLLAEYTGRDLTAWCGYPQNPGVLLERMAHWTDCSQEYRLVEVAGP